MALINAWKIANDSLQYLIMIVIEICYMKHNLRNLLEQTFTNRLWSLTRWVSDYAQFTD